MLKKIPIKLLLTILVLLLIFPSTACTASAFGWFGVAKAEISITIWIPDGDRNDGEIDESTEEFKDAGEKEINEEYGASEEDAENSVTKDAVTEEKVTEDAVTDNGVIEDSLAEDAATDGKVSQDAVETFENTEPLED